MPNSDKTLFENDRWWLESHPRAQPWEADCADILMTLTAAIEREIRNLCSRDLQDSDKSALVARLWDCWKYHWIYRSKAVPLRKGKEMLEAFEEWKPAAGIPLSAAAQKAIQKLGDVDRQEIWANIVSDRTSEFVLIYGLIQLDPRAQVSFNSQSESWAPAGAKQHPEIWSDLISDCVVKPTKVIGGFAGIGDLRGYLRTSFRRRVREEERVQRKKFPQQGAVLEVVSAEQQSIDQRVDFKECEQFILSKLPEAVAQLEHKEALTFLFFALDVRNMDIAAGLGKSRGQITRIRDASRRSVRAHFRTRYPQESWCLPEVLRLENDPEEQEIDPEEQVT